MKKFYILVCLSFVMLNSWGQLLTEPFNYTPHPTNGLNLQSGGLWSVVNTGDSILITSGNLNYPGLAASTGNKVSFDGAGADYYTDFTAQTTGTVYYSFVMNISSLGSLDATGGYFITLLQAGSTSAFGGTIWVRLSATTGKYNVGVSTRSNSAVSWLAADLDPGTPYFVVSAYEIISGTGNDVAKVWLNTPAIGGTEPAADATAVTGTDLSASGIGRILLRQDSDNETAFTEVDEIRVGTTWANVTPAGGPAPTLSSTTLTAFGNVCINTVAGPNSFTISGSNLTTANVTVAALAGFAYSTTAGGTYTPTLSLTQPGGTYSQQIFVQFSPTAVQSYNGNISIAGGGVAAPITVAAAGSGVGSTVPLLTTGAATAITTTTATAAGTITGTGCSSISAYGIEYSTTLGFPNGTGTAVPSSNLSGGNFTSNLSGLTPGTIYYYHAYATNSTGTGYGAEQTFTTTSTTPVTGVVISQVYGGGGNASATYNQDFVELFNRSSSTVDISGWSVQYASSAGTSWAVTTIPAATTIAPGKYYLIGLATGATGVPLPTPDLTNSTNMSGTAGKVALVSDAVALSGATACSASTVVDVLGYGTAASCSETAPLNPTGIDNTKSMFRKNNGCTETNDNSADFEVLAVSPRNSASAANLCGAPTAILTATTLADFGSVCTNTTVGPNSFTISGTNLTTANVTVAALNGFTYSTTSGGTYTPTLDLTQAGGTYSQQIFVRFTPTAIQSYNGNIVVAGGGASSINVAATGAGADNPPSLTTGSASAITQTTATAAGTITSTGCTAVTVYGIEYSTVNGFTPGTGTQVISSNLSGGNFTSSLSGLTMATTYYYRAYAANNGGVGYGPQQSFTTAAPPPPVLTATALSAFSPTCIATTAGPNSFTINGNNLTTAALTVGPLTGFTFSETSGGTYAASISITQTGGTQSKTVYVRFTPTIVQSYNGNIPVGGGGAATINVAVVASGVNTVATVVTGAASNLTNHSGTLSGSIAANGCSNVTTYGIEYSGVSGFANGNGISVASTNLAGGVFSSAITGLVQGATYYYKAYATNSGGTAYGAEQAFTVTAVSDVFSLYPVPVEKGNEMRVTMKNITPGYYGLLFFNSAGQLVYQWNMNIQVNFINQTFNIPATIQTGTYQVQLVNHLTILATKTILIN